MKGLISSDQTPNIFGGRHSDKEQFLVGVKPAPLISTINLNYLTKNISYPPYMSLCLKMEAKMAIMVDG